MLPDEELWAFAAAMVELYGEEAPARSMERAAELESRATELNASLWRMVAVKAGQLLAARGSS